MLDDATRQGLALDQEEVTKRWKRDEDLKRELREVREAQGTPIRDTLRPDPDLLHQVEAIRERIVQARRSALTSRRVGAYDQ